METKTLKDRLSEIDRIPSHSVLNRALNRLLCTKGIDYPQGALSAYIIKAEILKGNLKAIRLEAKIKGEYIRQREEQRNIKTEKEIAEEAEMKAKIKELNSQIKAARIKLGKETEDTPQKDRSLQEWIAYIDSHIAPQTLQRDMNRVFNTKGQLYPIEALSAYILKRETLRGNLNAIRLESTIRGSINGKAERREYYTLFTLYHREDELRELQNELNYINNN